VQGGERVTGTPHLLVMHARLIVCCSVVCVQSRFRGTVATETQCANNIHTVHLNRCFCDCVLVDVGLNNGDSIHEWPKAAVANLKKYQHPWQLTRRMNECNNLSRVCVYGFEANPAFDHTLHSLEQQLQSSHVSVKFFTSTAFSTHAENVQFFAEPASSGTGQTISTLDPRMLLMSVTNGKWKRNESAIVKDHYHKIQVAAVDAGSFLSELLGASGFIALKLDIEAFEYTLLPHLLLTRPQTLCALNVLMIEWHEFWQAPHHRGKMAHITWMMRQPWCNVTLLSWH